MATVKYNLGTVGGMAVTELWSGIEGSITSSKQGSITLNDDITNYKFLVFDLKVAWSSASIRRITRIISVEQMKNFINDNSNNISVSFTWGYSNNDDYFDISYGTTTKMLKYYSNKSECLRIVGIN